MTDPLADHLEMMTDMSSSRHYNQPYCYAETEEQEEPERIAGEAALRVARASWRNTKALMDAMGVKP